MTVSSTLRRLTLGALGALAAAFTPASAADPLFVPVFQEDFADPFVLPTPSGFIAYSTNRGLNLPMATSRDLVHWEFVRDPADPKKLRDGMPQLGAWAKEGLTWAPEVMNVGGRWVLYYTAHDRKRNVQCIGAAISADPEGPFTDSLPGPLVCQPELGGTIDANPFRDSDGKLYLYYKNDGNALGKPSFIWGQRLSDDGLSVTGAASGLIRDDAAWENKLVEAPTMVATPSGYRLLFSAAFFGWNSERLSPYATGYATCSGPMGPCRDAPENPILHSFNDKEAGCLSGPGHTSVFRAAGRTFLAFHAWSATKGCRKADDKRFLYIAPLSWKDGKPVIGVGLRPRP
jgi:beta-xylosidase